MSDGLMGLIIGYLLGNATFAIMATVYFRKVYMLPDEPIEYDEIN